MPYRRRYNRRRRPYVRRRTYGRRSSRRTYRRSFKRRRLSQKSVYRFKRSVNYTFTNNDVVAQSAGYAFFLAQLPNSSEFATLFDEYRIWGVKIILTPQINDIGPGEGTGTFYYIIDRNDIIPWTSESQVLEYQGIKAFTPGLNRGSRTLYVSKPSVRTAVGVTTNDQTLSVGMIKSSPWLTFTGVTGSDQIPHYGFKYYWSPSVNQITMKMTMIYYIHCRNVK